jgi:hypothetical protein
VTQVLQNDNRDLLDVDRLVLHLCAITRSFLTTPRSLKQISYALCYSYHRATRSVSIPAPVYYADVRDLSISDSTVLQRLLAALRARRVPVRSVLGLRRRREHRHVGRYFRPCEMAARLRGAAHPPPASVLVPVIYGVFASLCCPTTRVKSPHSVQSSWLWSQCMLQCGALPVFCADALVCPSAPVPAWMPSMYEYPS